MSNLNVRDSRDTAGPRASNLLPPKPPSLLEQLFPTSASPQKSAVTTQIPKTSWAAAAAKAASPLAGATEKSIMAATTTPYVRAETAKQTAAKRFTYNSGYKGLGSTALSQMLGITPEKAQDIINQCPSELYPDYNTCVGQYGSKRSSSRSRNARPSLNAPREIVPCGRFSDMMRQKRTNRAPFSEEDIQDAKRCNINLMALQPFDASSSGLHAQEYKWIKRGPDEVGDEWFEEIGNKNNTIWLPRGWYIHKHDGITEYVDPNGNMYPSLPDYIGFDGMGHWTRRQKAAGGKRQTKRKTRVKKTRVKKSRRASQSFRKNKI